MLISGRKWNDSHLIKAWSVELVGFNKLRVLGAQTGESTILGDLPGPLRPRLKWYNLFSTKRVILPYNGPLEDDQCENVWNQQGNAETPVLLEEMEHFWIPQVQLCANPNR